MGENGEIYAAGKNFTMRGANWTFRYLDTQHDPISKNPNRWALTERADNLSPIRFEWQTLNYQVCNHIKPKTSRQCGHNGRWSRRVYGLGSMKRPRHIEAPSPPAPHQRLLLCHVVVVVLLHLLVQRQHQRHQQHCHRHLIDHFDHSFHVHYLR